MRSRVMAMIPSARPVRTASIAQPLPGRFSASVVPETPMSSHHSTTLCPLAFAHASICCRWTSGPNASTWPVVDTRT